MTIQPPHATRRMCRLFWVVLDMLDEAFRFPFLPAKIEAHYASLLDSIDGCLIPDRLCSSSADGARKGNGSMS